MDPIVILTFLITIAIDILLPLVIALCLQRRFRVSWLFFGYGALIFLVFQLATRIPAIQAGQYFLADVLKSDQRYLIAWMLLAAVTAGLFEEGGRYLGYRFLWKKEEEKTWEKSLMYGAGHGGLESIVLVGGLAILSLIGGLSLSQLDPNTSSLPPDQIEAIRQAKEVYTNLLWWKPLLGAAERIMVMPIQIALSVLVLQAFVRRNFLWWWLALGYHTLVDLLPVLLTLGYVTELQVELLLLPFGLLGIGIIFWLRPPKEPQ